MINKLSGEDIIAMQHVKRWHMVRIGRQQSVAEHSATVAMLALKMASLADPDIEETIGLSAQVMELALCHDVHEVEYGDIPGIAKSADENVKKVDEWTQKAFWHKRGVEWSGSPTFAMRMVELADKLEGFLFYTLEGADLSLREKCWVSVQKRLSGENKAVRDFVWGLASSVQSGEFTPQPDKDPEQEEMVFPIEDHQNERPVLVEREVDGLRMTTLPPIEIGPIEVEIDKLIREYESKPYGTDFEVKSLKVLFNRLFEKGLLTRKQEDLTSLQAMIGRWADSVFPDRTPHETLTKLIMEEIPEFLQNLDSPGEYADLAILIFDLGYQRGIEVIPAVMEKMKLNKARTWTKDPETGLYSHVPGSSPEEANAVAAPNPPEQGTKE